VEPRSCSSATENTVSPQALWEVLVGRSHGVESLEFRLLSQFLYDICSCLKRSQHPSATSWLWTSVTVPPPSAG
jgi:hypothetical protein